MHNPENTLNPTQAVSGDQCPLHPKMCLMRWWLPMTWTVALVNTAKDDEVKEKKDFIAFLNRYQTALRQVIEYQTNPLPKTYGQALFLAVFSWLILGVFSSQYLDNTYSWTWIFFAFPSYQVQNKYDFQF